MIMVVLPVITAQLASKLIVDNDAFTNDEQEEIKAALRLLPELKELLARTQAKLDVIYNEVDDVEEQNAASIASSKAQLQSLEQTATGVEELLRRVPKRS